MEKDRARIRINLSTREIEIEGSDPFLKNYETLISEYANKIKNASENALKKEQKQNSSNQNDTGLEDGTPSFGEFFTKFQKIRKDVDKILIAGYFLQLTKESKSFETREASTLLIQQNVKLTNPSAFIKSNLDTRKIFRLTNNEFRVSDSGIEHLNTLKEKGGETA